MSGIKKQTSKFNKGDHVVYPAHGVGLIKGFEDQEIAGHSLELIVIDFEKDRMTLRVPKMKAETSGLRRLSTKDEMDSAIKTLKGRSRVRRTMWSRRAQEYEAKSIPATRFLLPKSFATCTARKTSPINPIPNGKCIRQPWIGWRGSLLQLRKLMRKLQVYGWRKL